jgi:quinolinate synthase
MLCGASYLAGEIEKRGALGKPLLIPRADIACPLSDAVTLSEVLAAKSAHPEALIVADIRASCEIKEVADLEISSQNARQLLAQTGERPIIALPGPHLADLAGFGARVVNRWPRAVCQVHEQALPEELAAAQSAHPGAIVAAHSLAHPGVLARADFIGDSAAICHFCAQSPAHEFIVVAESGLADYLTETLPGKVFHETEAEIFCPNMKLTNLKSIITCLEEFQQQHRERN